MNKIFVHIDRSRKIHSPLVLRKKDSYKERKKEHFKEGFIDETEIKLQCKHLAKKVKLYLIDAENYFF